MNLCGKIVIQSLNVLKAIVILLFTSKQVLIKWAETGDNNGTYDRVKHP